MNGMLMLIMYNQIVSRVKCKHNNVDIQYKISVYLCILNERNGVLDIDFVGSLLGNSW